MDPLDEYRSDEDEDYVPGNEVDIDDFDQQPAGQHAAKGKGAKRKRAAAGIELLAPKRLPIGAKVAKKKGAARIGAAVLSDDDDDLLQQPQQSELHVEESKEDIGHDHNKQQEEERKESGPRASEDDTAVIASEGAAAHTTERGHTDAPDSASTQPPITVTLPPTAAVASSTASPTSSSSSAAPAGTKPASSPPAATAAKPGDMASILAQFNKKPTTTKSATKRVINPWELPTKLKPSTPSPAPTSTDATTAAIASASPTAPPAALSTEQVVVTDITSYAGETIQVTKTLIRGSAEELAHRAATSNNLTALLSSLTNQRAISTLEKSRLDWSVSKEEEGDEDELRRFVGSKDAYVDRMAFLARTERREWENVKAARDAGRKQTMTASTEGMDGD